MTASTFSYKFTWLLLARYPRSALARLGSNKKGQLHHADVPDGHLWGLTFSRWGCSGPPMPCGCNQDFLSWVATSDQLYDMHCCLAPTVNLQNRFLNLIYRLNSGICRLGCVLLWPFLRLSLASTSQGKGKWTPTIFQIFLVPRCRNA